MRENTSRTVDWVLVTLLLLIFGFWLWGLNWLHMRPDEHLVYQHTSGNLIETVLYQAQRDVQAPLWHIFFWNWRQLVEDGEFAGRYQGVLWSVLTLSLVYLLIKTWFRRIDSAWIAVSALAVNAYFFTYTFEIRPYPIVMLSATFSMWSLWRWLQSHRWRHAIYYGISLALLAYIHYFLFFLVAMQLIYVMATGVNQLRLRQYVTALMVGVLLWLPWMPTFFNQVMRLRQIEGSLGIASTTTQTTWPVIQKLLMLGTNGLPWLLGLIVVLGLLRRLQREYVLLVMWGVGVPILAFIVNLWVNVYDPRYVSYLAVGLSLAVGVGLSAVPFRWLRGVGTLAFVGVMLWQLPHHLPNRTTYRPIFQTMSDLSQSEDVIFFDQADYGRDVVRWQIEQYVDADLLARRVISLDEAQQHRRVWHVTANLFNADVQENFRQLEKTRPLQVALGECQTWCYVAQLLEGATYEPTYTFTASNGDEIVLDGVDVVDIQPHHVRLRLWWSTPKPIQLNYSMSVRLVDALGNIVVASDSPPIDRNGERIDTSQLDVGRVTEDRRELSATSGEYTLQIVVYDSLSGDVMQQDEPLQTSIQTITIP